MTEYQDFECLERAAKGIAARRDDRGDQELVRAYLDDIEARWREGRLSFEHWARLVAVLQACQPKPRANPLA